MLGLGLEKRKVILKGGLDLIKYTLHYIIVILPTLLSFIVLNTYILIFGLGIVTKIDNKMTSIYEIIIKEL